VTQKPDTTAITAGRGDSRGLATPLDTSTVWQQEGLDDMRRRATGLRHGGVYGRYSNPTVAMFENAVAELEGAGSALAFGSGMGAIASLVLTFCSQGSHIVAQNNLYGATLGFLQGPCRRFGIDTTFVDPSVPGAFEAAVQPGRTMLVIGETPSNPRLAVTDLAEIGRINGPFTVVDSTMATPMGQRPIDFGVDFVLHSATKGIGGHNDALLGVLAGEKDLIDAVWAYSVMHGSVASPHDAHNALRGIRTLAVRTERQHATALHLARAISSHARVSGVLHPFLESHPQNDLARRQMRMGGTLLAVEVTGGTDACRALIGSLKLARPATSFGGPETLICHPATAIQVGVSEGELSATGVTDGLVRVSVGLENAEDLVADFTAALDAL
jgi:cystathionine beta-lyase/cystathionine gamma-synthase